MVEQKLPKLTTWVRFPSPAPISPRWKSCDAGPASTTRRRLATCALRSKREAIPSALPFVVCPDRSLGQIAKPLVGYPSWAFQKPDSGTGHIIRYRHSPRWPLAISSRRDRLGKSCAGVAQWQSRSFPSLRRGFDSLHPLHLHPFRKFRGIAPASTAHAAPQSLATCAPKLELNASSPVKGRMARRGHTQRLRVLTRPRASPARFPRRPPLR